MTNEEFMSEFGSLDIKLIKIPNKVSNNKIIVETKADENDADYVCEKTEIDIKNNEEISALLKVLKVLKKYLGKYYDTIRFTDEEAQTILDYEIIMATNYADFDKQTLEEMSEKFTVDNFSYNGVPGWDMYFHELLPQGNNEYCDGVKYCHTLKELNVWFVNENSQKLKVDLGK
jgi:hypothetical protein